MRFFSFTLALCQLLFLLCASESVAMNASPKETTKIKASRNPTQKFNVKEKPINVDTRSSINTDDTKNGPVNSISDVENESSATEATAPNVSMVDTSSSDIEREAAQSPSAPDVEMNVEDNFIEPECTDSGFCTDSYYHYLNGHLYVLPFPINIEDDAPNEENCFMEFFH